MNRSFHREFSSPRRLRRSGFRPSVFSLFSLLLAVAFLFAGMGCATAPYTTVPARYPGPRRGVARIPFSRSQIRTKLMKQHQTWKGTGYRLGGMSRRGVDCSGFVHVTFRDQLKLKLPRSTRDLAQTGIPIRKKDLAPGDLVLFKTGWGARHVGIYVGRSRFIHASKSKGVTLSSLRDTYWSRRFWMARRVAVPARGG